MNKPWLPWIAPLLIIGAVIAVYWGSGDHLKQGQDNAVVWSNPAVLEGGEDLVWGRFYRTEDEFRPVVRPLPTLLHRIEYTLYRQDRTPFQNMQIGVHVLVALLFFFTLRGVGARGAPALLAALAFGVHPGLTMSVLHLEGVSEILCLGFLLLAFSAARRSVATDPYDPQPWGWIVFAWLSALAALLSKEVAFALIPALLLWIHLSRRPASERPRERQGEPRRSATETVLAVGLIVVALVAIGYRTLSLAQVGEALHQARFITPDIGMEAGRRALMGLASLVEYARLTVFPLELAYTYDFLHDLEGNELMVRVVIGGVVLLAPVVLVIMAAARRRAAFAFWSLFLFGALVAASGMLFSVGDYVSERGLYFIVPGVLALLVLAYTRYRADRHAGRADLVLTVVALLAVGLLGARTATRADDFLGETQLWEAQLRSHPDSAQPYFEQGNRFLSRMETAAARGQYEKAIELREDFWMAWVNLGTAYSAENELGLAIRSFDRAIGGMRGEEAHATTMARALYNQALAYMKQNRNSEAVERLKRTLTVFPDHLAAHANLGFIFANSAEFDEEAKFHLNRAMELETNDERRQSLVKTLQQIERRRERAEQNRQRFGAPPSESAPDTSGNGVGSPGQPPDDPGAGDDGWDQP